jgi:sugar (pentulose or hexulose) kinase
VLTVAASSFATSLVALDKGGHPLGPALCYADTRAAAEVPALPSDPDRLPRTGCPTTRLLARPDPLVAPRAPGARGSGGPVGLGR